MRRFQIIVIMGLLCALTACGVVKDNENDTISSAIVEDLDNKQVFDEDGLSGLKDTELNNLIEEDSMIEENDSSEYDELVCEEDFSENDEMKSIENVLEELAGEYEYTTDYGVGKLIIQRTEWGYDISDYKEDSSYRFLANASNIINTSGNRFVIEYPAHVYEDDTVIFEYYTLAYNHNEIEVSYCETEEGDTTVLYTAILLDHFNEEKNYRW